MTLHTTHVSMRYLVWSFVEVFITLIILFRFFVDLSCDS